MRRLSFGLLLSLGAFAVLPRIAVATTLALESVASGSAYVGGFVTPSCECELNANRIEVFKEPIDLDERGIVEFDISTLQASSVVSAEVVLPFNRYSNPSEATRTWDIAAYAGDGLLGIDDWGAGIDIVSGVPFLGEALFTFDVTSALISHLLAGDQYIGFTIRQREQITNSSAEFFAQHQLLVTTPEPTSATLILLGTAAVVVRGRRELAGIRRADAKRLMYKQPAQA